MLMAVRRDSMERTGTSPNPRCSFVSFSKELIVSRASKLGISLGTSPSQIENSVENLKVLEESRNLTFLQNNLPPLAEGESHSLVMRKASNLCEDLDNEEAEGLGDHSDLSFQGVKVTCSRKKVKK